jgi:hypothetical protein
MSYEDLGKRSRIPLGTHTKFPRLSILGSRAVEERRNLLSSKSIARHSKLTNRRSRDPSICPSLGRSLNFRVAVDKQSMNGENRLPLTKGEPSHELKCHHEGPTVCCDTRRV